MKLYLSIILLLTACGHKDKGNQTPELTSASADVNRAPKVEATPPNPIKTPEVESPVATPPTEPPVQPVAKTPEPAKADVEQPVITKPLFDEAAYLKEQEAKLLTFVDGLKAIKIYDEIPQFLKANQLESQKGGLFTQPFTDSPKYLSSLQPFPYNRAPCAGFAVGTEYRVLGRLRDAGSFPPTYAAGVEYRVFLGVSADNRLLIYDIDARWKSLDGTYQVYSMGTLCSDGSLVLPAVVGYNY
ncbi:MAG: hypothetical protein NTX25_02265 [Proteobacteria bacterium]|nr:hypothetical protein [Pseudomonadota bacterium]